MRSTSTFIARSLTHLPALLAVVMLASCSKDPVSSGDTTISNDDAAGLFALAYAKPGGFLMNLGHAVDVSRGGSLTGKQKEKGSTVLHDTSVARTGQFTAAGVPGTFTYSVKYTYFFTSNNFNNPRDNFYVGNTELRFSTTMQGTITGSKIAAVDSAWSDLFFNRTDSTFYQLSGKFGRTGTYTFAGSSKTFTGTINTEGIPGVSIAKAMKNVDDSGANNIEVNIRGTDKSGAAVRIGGLYVMRPGQPPRVRVGGKDYVIDVESGTATTP